MATLIDTAVSKLALIQKALDAFHQEEIIYCHWKSNEHLDASMTGDTDLDILFSEPQREEIEHLLLGLGFKQFNSIKEKQYKDIEDFIGLDIQSGKLIHIHAHFRLTMGETYLKGYQLDFEEKLLEMRIFNETFGIYTSTPAFELILLFIRESLKLRHREVAKMIILNRNKYTGNALVEYEWLKSRATNKEIEEILKDIFVNYQPIYEFVIGEFNRRELYKLSFLIKKELKKHRLYTPWQALQTRWYREATILLSRKLAILLNQPILSQRINPRGGMVVAVVGADGSGKSTVISNLQDTFKTKLDVFRIYFGRGDGRISIPRKLLYLAKKAIKSTPDHKSETKSKPATTKKNGFAVDLYKCAEALIVANEKRLNLKQMQAARKKGMLVICDRFPQNQVMGYNDGPLLHYLTNSKNPFFRMMAKKEAKIYAKAERNLPDIIFKLVADAHIVEARKPGETSLEMLENKIDGIKKLHFNNKCNVFTIDAAQPLNQVLATVKQGLWDTYP